jgi:hypothetical protein
MNKQATPQHGNLLQKLASTNATANENPHTISLLRQAIAERNGEILKAKEKNIISVMRTVSIVSVYSYNMEKKDWNSCGIEGEKKLRLELSSCLSLHYFVSSIISQ